MAWYAQSLENAPKGTLTNLERLNSSGQKVAVAQCGRVTAQALTVTSSAVGRKAWSTVVSLPAILLTWVMLFVVPWFILFYYQVADLSPYRFITRWSRTSRAVFVLLVLRTTSSIPCILTAWCMEPWTLQTYCFIGDSYSLPCYIHQCIYTNLSPGVRCLLVVCVIYTYIFPVRFRGAVQLGYLHMTVRDWEYDAWDFENMFTTISMKYSWSR